jgi:hypothetical protein
MVNKTHLNWLWTVTKVRRNREESSVVDLVIVTFCYWQEVHNKYNSWLPLPNSLNVYQHLDSGRLGRDRMVVGFTTTCAISALWVRTPLRRGVLDTTLCDKVCQWLATGRWSSLGTPISSTNKTNRRDITEILLKVAQDTINHQPTSGHFLFTLSNHKELNGRHITWIRVIFVSFSSWMIDVWTQMVKLYISQYKIHNYWQFISTLYYKCSIYRVTRGVVRGVRPPKIRKAYAIQR